MVEPDGIAHGGVGAGVAVSATVGSQPTTLDFERISVRFTLYINAPPSVTSSPTVCRSTFGPARGSPLALDIHSWLTSPTHLPRCSRKG